MKLSGEKSKDKIAQLASMLPVGKQVVLSFSKHTDNAKLVSCTLATQASIKSLGGNVPNKRKDTEGKEYTPQCITLHFNNDTDYYLHIVIEDIDVFQKVNGAIIRVPSAEISILEAKD